MRFSSLVLVSSLAALTACGGGGGGGGSGGGTSSTTTTPTNYNMHEIVGARVKTTVTHAFDDEQKASAIATITDGLALPVGGPSSLSSFTVNNGVDSMAINTSVASTPGIYSQVAGTRTSLIGGTTWNYARYGVFVARTPNSNGVKTQYIVRSMPFTYANKYHTTNLSNATYNQGNAKAVGTLTATDAAWTTITCDISVAFSIVGSAQTADFTPSGCKDHKDAAVATSGFVRATKPNNTDASANSVNGTTPFTATVGGNTFTVSSVSIMYTLAGPNAEEMVGTIFMHGNTSVAGNSKLTYISMAFGAKK